MVGMTLKRFRGSTAYERISKHTEGLIIPGCGMTAMHGDSLGISGPKEQSAPGYWELAFLQLGDSGVGLHCWGVFVKHLGHTGLSRCGDSGEIKAAWPLPFKQLMDRVASQ